MLRILQRRRVDAPRPRRARSGVSVIDPQLSLLPQIEPNGLLHMAGFFPLVPSQVNFELLFAPVEGQWRVFGVSLLVGQAAPAAATADALLGVVYDDVPARLHAMALRSLTAHLLKLEHDGKARRRGAAWLAC